MDGFEAVRQEAAKLHSEVVAKGRDPLKPSSIMDGALEKLGLEVAFVEAKDVSLNGGQALFDEQSGYIICENLKDEVLRLLLVAHEIGHAVIHSGSEHCREDDIDPSRPQEPSPVGLARVEDYGPRERRELQANVFAREFLFPRFLARKLHIDESLGAREISEKTKLPINLIRQQLFDGLLLPQQTEPLPATPPEQESVVDPNPSQARAADHREAPFLLQAGPGTGKTQTLIARVISLLKDGVDPSTILVLTFSNRAAGELSERIALTEPDAVQNIWIGTFHAFGLDLIRRFHDRLDLPANPALFDKSDAIDLLEESLPLLDLVHYRNLFNPGWILPDVISAISRAKDELCGPSRYRELSEAMLKAAKNEDEHTAAEKCLEVAGIYEQYENVKKAKGAVDFGDLIMMPTRVLESDQELPKALQTRHRHVLVDEYQDVNRASARLLHAVAGEGENLWVVGDSRQSIYRFRGASSANMGLFSQDYAGTVIDQLSVNYRSTKQIVKAFSTFSRNMGTSKTGEMLRLSLQANKGIGPCKPEIQTYTNKEEETAGVATSIQELIDAGIALKDQAVLCRTYSGLNQIAAALEASGIPALYLGSLFERDEVRDLLALLSLAVDSSGKGLVRLGAFSRYSLNLQDVYITCSHIRELDSFSLDDLKHLYEIEGVSEQGIEGLKLLASDLVGFKQSTHPWELLATYLLDRTDMVRLMAQTNSVSGQMRAIAVWQFLNFVRERPPTGSGLPIKKTLERVRQLVLLNEDRDLRQVPSCVLDLDAVKLMTMHGSKGLEFEAVHIPGLYKSNIPKSQQRNPCPPPVGMIAGAESLTVSAEAKRAYEHEEECLFFVAISRAQTYLKLYTYERQPNGHRRNPSDFLDWMPNDVVSRATIPASSTCSTEGRPAFFIDLTLPKNWQVTDRTLRAYERCPMRFFYIHVLGLRGGQKQTAFTRTHTCLQKILSWMVKARCETVPTLQEAEIALDEVWMAHGPCGHPFESDYRKLARRLVNNLVQSGTGRNFCTPEKLMVGGEIVVEPDEFGYLASGTPVLRRVRTGKKRSNEYDNLEYTLYHLAARENFGADYIVEALHLTDNIEEAAEITERKIQYRKAKSEKLLSNILNGEFPPMMEDRNCPRCPHFFICAAIPEGPLTLPE